jgi:hypothetical protein
VSPESPRVFISYAWEDEEYRLWVKRLATRLREDGVDARLDAWHLGANDSVPDFMNREIRQARWVLVLCSPACRSKVHATEDQVRSTGVGWEARLLSGHWFAAAENKVIAALARGTWLDSAPDFLRATRYDDLSDPQTFETRYRELLRRLTDTSEKPPPLGVLPADLDAQPVEPLRGLDTAPTVILQKYLSPSKIVYTRVTAEGVFDWDLSPIAAYDFFDTIDPEGRQPRVTAILFLPNTDYFKKPPSNKRFTAITAICCLEPNKIASDFMQSIQVENLDVLGRWKMEIWERERLFSIMAATLGGTFIVSVALPSALLWAGLGKPSISYRAICGVLVVPLVELHRTLKVEEFHLRFPKIGECTQAFRGMVRGVLNNAYPKKGQASVDAIEEGSSFEVLADMAKHISYAVERLYRQPEPDKKWISYFEQK